MSHPEHKHKQAMAYICPSTSRDPSPFSEKALNILILTIVKRLYVRFVFAPCRHESMTFEIIVVTGVISRGRTGQNCREDLSKLLCQLLFICDRIARGSTSR